MQKGGEFPTYSFGEKHQAYLQKTKSCCYNIAEGSIRAGKTTNHIFAFAHYLRRSKDYLHLATASTEATARLIIGDGDGLGLEHFFSGQCHYGKYRGHSCLYICGEATGFREIVVLFCGGALSNSYKKLRGMSLGLWIATEIDLHHENTIKEALRRQTNADIRKCFWDLNPNAPGHRIYTEYIDKWIALAREGALQGGVNYGHFTIFDNSTISKEKVDSVVSRYTKGSVDYSRDILGLRCAAEGLIYPRFANGAERFLTTAVPPLFEVSVGVDFGGNLSAHAFVATGVTEGHEALYALCSERHFQREYKDGVDAALLSRLLAAFVGRVLEVYGRCDYLYWDNEATTLGTTVKQAVEAAYPNVRVRPCKKRKIRDRIDLTKRLIAEGRFFYTEDACSVKDALCGAVWDSCSLEDVRLDNGSCDIDTLDAFEYAFTSASLQRYL